MLSASELDALEPLLRELAEQGRAQWPTLEVEPSEFAGHVARSVGAAADVVGAVERIRGAELYLAFACSRASKAAMLELENNYGAHLQAAVTGVGGHALGRDDLRQIVRDGLFVAPQGRGAKISGYGGHGSLAAWLRVTARRIALNAVRSPEVSAESSDDGELFDFPEPQGDPELDYLKHTYREEFRAAFMDAVGVLPPQGADPAAPDDRAWHDGSPDRSHLPSPSRHGGSLGRFGSATADRSDPRLPQESSPMFRSANSTASWG